MSRANLANNFSTIFKKGVLKKVLLFCLNNNLFAQTSIMDKSFVFLHLQSLMTVKYEQYY